MTMDKYRLEEHQQLLQALKATVEGLLISQVSNVWNIYGGLNRLYNAMKNIFKHGCRVFTQDGEPDCWVFIQGLTWLQPALANSPTFFCEDKDTFVHLPKGVTNDKASYWLFKSLEGHTLSQKLSWLLSDRSHLASCYEPYAFLCRRDYGEAALVCLRAVEQSQPSLLTEIDPCLYLTRWKWQPFHKSHRRCSSFPETFRNKPWNEGSDDESMARIYPEETPAVTILVREPLSDEDKLLKNNALPINFPQNQRLSGKKMHLEVDESDTLKLGSHSSDSGMRTVAMESERRASDQRSRDRKGTYDSLVPVGDMGRCWSSLPSLVSSKKEESRGRSSTMVSSTPAPSVEGTSGEFFQSSSFKSSTPRANNPVEGPKSHGGNVVASSGDYLAYQGKKNDLFRHTPVVRLADEELMPEYSNPHHKLLPSAMSQRPCQLQLQAAWVEEDKGTSANGRGNRLDVEYSPVIVGSAPVGFARDNWTTRESQNQHADNVWLRNYGASGVGHENTLPFLMGSSISTSALNWRAAPISGIWSSRYKQSFLEAGGIGVVPMWTGFFPQPARGQSLTSFLSSGQFARSAAELDRENAHFAICEAMIAAVEQVKTNRLLGIKSSSVDDDDSALKEEESDEEINQLNQKIRLRRKQLRQEKERNNHRILPWAACSMTADGKTDTTTTEQSVSPFSSSSVGSYHSSTPSSSSTSPTYPLSQSPAAERRKRSGGLWRKKAGNKESSQSSVEELTLDDNVNGLTKSRDTGLSLSMASLYSDADLSHWQNTKSINGSKLKSSHPKIEKVCLVGAMKVGDEARSVPIVEAAAECVPSDASEGEEKNVNTNESEAVDCNAAVVSLSSAEGVALSLLRKFSEKQLPKASDLEWLVSERDVPQQLLPLPGSWPVSPDEAEDEDMKQATPLRGTFEWAPPRPQIIFTPHPSPNHRVVMAKQGHRCAGCGMKVAQEYAHRFRYCEYLGRYFCTGCHSNQLALIPGRVLTKWDFTRCPVSIFSYRLLEQMMSDPLYSVGDLNPGLYKKAKALERTRTLRTQLHHLREFLLACRFATDLQESLEREPQYLSSDPEVYSLQDLVLVKSGELTARVKALVDAGIAHVAQCQLCMARGFVCELCASTEIIHPWQIPKVSRCAGCGACFHASCREAREDKKKRKGQDGTQSDSCTCPRCRRLWERQRQRMQPKQSEDELDEGDKEEATAEAPLKDNPKLSS
ncbi:run domain Beclin-1-interacting and cysteine-rich domain-containing protein isoform X2 [Ischnura elegans]|uniref:run domain Beclin-1-interacting and cysteine-rich domain-containing protein isoform X2 n=1 Tax=Ischnura elegans TaxID=197161 RepID=UPI001ED880C2|nr:run domain Beclin-1-interacting and cysteine-rich domain-containing protein isoform X2 [Ischnura elegans]